MRGEDARGGGGAAFVGARGKEPGDTAAGQVRSKDNREKVNGWLGEMVRSFYCSKMKITFLLVCAANTIIDGEVVLFGWVLP